MILRLCFFLLAATPAAPDEPPPVLLLRPPGGGYQPQAVAEPSGRIHVLAFVGDPAGGDLQYSWRDPATKQFSEPIRINSEPGSAVARGTMRGGQLALGRGGRVHVAWNGSEQSKTRNAAGSTPMLYARSNPERTAFEPQRNLMRKTSALDGGGSVAADRAGHVFVSWHGLGPDAPDGAVGRKLYVAKSDDDGATFADERPALARETGACPCCGTRSLADADGNLLILYRAAIGGTSRDMFLAQSHDAGKTFEGRSIHPWKIETCPMSSESMAEADGAVVAAWETAGKVYFAKIDPATGEPSKPIAPAGEGSRKHPSVAVNKEGQVLMAWAEGTSFQRGGDLAWQVFDADGAPIGEPGRVEGGIPLWGLPSAVALPDGSFAIVH